MRNYLARLGWSHGDDELFTDAQATEWFDLGGIGKSPARLDFKKLENVCQWHIAQMEDAALLGDIETYLAAASQPALSQSQKDGLKSALYCTKDRAKSLPELLMRAAFVLNERPIKPDEKALVTLDNVSRGILKSLTAQLQNATWTREGLETLIGAVAEAHETKLGKLAAPLRAALSGQTVSPSVFDMMLVLGRDESIARLTDATVGAD